MKHHPNCSANYPEKLKHEAARQIVRQYIDGKYYIDICVDCGATEDSLPPEEDPYWDDARAALDEMTRRR